MGVAALVCLLAEHGALGQRCDAAFFVRSRGAGGGARVQKWSVPGDGCGDVPDRILQKIWRVWFWTREVVCGVVVVRDATHAWRHRRFDAAFGSGILIKEERGGVEWMLPFLVGQWSNDQTQPNLAIFV